MKIKGISLCIFSLLFLGCSHSPTLEDTVSNTQITGEVVMYGQRSF